MTEGGRFIKDLLVDDVSECPLDESPVVGNDEVLSDDNEQYSTMRVESDQVGSIYGCPCAQPTYDCDQNRICPQI